MCFRGVAQLVARLVRDQEAVGSNPATSTKLAFRTKTQPYRTIGADFLYP